jgi:hypothetical protein
MKLYNLSNRAYQQYRWNTSGNRNTPKHIARLKLSRNIALGKVVAENETHVIYRYGYLNIGVLKELDLIVDVHNEFMAEPYEPDLDTYININEFLGLETNDKEV